MQRESPWINPSHEQEKAWQDQRLAALNNRQQAVRNVMRLHDLESRRRFLADYMERWGLHAAESLELSVRAEWDRRRNV
jgi:hypothetical protein